MACFHGCLFIVFALTIHQQTNKKSTDSMVDYGIHSCRRLFRCQYAKSIRWYGFLFISFVLHTLNKTEEKKNEKKQKKNYIKIMLFTHSSLVLGIFFFSFRMDNEYDRETKKSTIFRGKIWRTQMTMCQIL